MAPIASDSDAQNAVGHSDPEQLIGTITTYLADHRIRLGPPVIPHEWTGSPEEIASAAFELLTRREFCYLSRSRSEVYRESVVPWFQERIERGEPLRLYYDLGGGYHASLDPEHSGVCFDIGLGEWFVLSQISRFVRRLRELYRPGAEFRIVIDNLCALAVNDIPITGSAGYVAQLRELIRVVGMEGVADLLVESEVLDPTGYLDAVQVECSGIEPSSISDRDNLNVNRFLGRCCTRAEALDRVGRYRPAGRASDRMMQPFIDGPRLTQRATAATLCFRPFPGGDSRIQAGQVAMALGSRGNIHPVLVTNLSFGHIRLLEFAPPPPLPAQIGTITAVLDWPT